MSIVYTKKAPAPMPYLSQAVFANNTLFISGNTGVNPVDGKFVPGTIKDRTTRALLNIGLVLNEAGMGMEDIVAVTIYLSKYTKDFEAMNEAYIAAFPKGIFPSRTCIGVAALPGGTDVEITCTAVKKPKAKL